MTKHVDIQGKKFGRLTAVEFIPGPRPHWSCKCDCGNITTASYSKLHTGHTKSCGCYMLEVSKKNGEANFTHKMSHHPLYHTWVNMIARCYHPDRPDYPYYGGRGIQVCERWRESPENFIVDMSPRPPNTTLERTDVNGNYGPDICIWATRKAQARNRRNNVLLTFKGETKYMTDWCEELGINQSTLSCRLSRGWSVEDALTKTAIDYRKSTRGKTIDSQEHPG